MSDPREVVDLGGGRFGRADGDPKPLPNAADAAWAELQNLRAEAVTLGLEVRDAEPLERLRGRVLEARVARG